MRAAIAVGRLDLMASSVIMGDILSRALTLAPPQALFNPAPMSMIERGGKKRRS
jgi:hypothetical protein